MEILKKYLPSEILREIKTNEPVEEIHIKKNAPFFYTVGERKIFSKSPCREEVFSHLLELLVRRSYHTYCENIINGYIPLECGLRAGVVGRAVMSGDRVTNISDIESVNIRIPHLLHGISRPIVKELERRNFNCSALIFSAPGEGKTTLLRDLISVLSGEAYKIRCCVIDSRNEIVLPQMQASPLLDCYFGYPKEKAIEQAVRTMNPQMIFCDEIDSSAECEAILQNAGCGVPIIATVHAETLSELRSKNSIKEFEKQGIFKLCFSVRKTPKTEIKMYEGLNAEKC